MADDLEGVTVWNIANPSNINALTHYPAATGASHLFINGTRAYVARRNLGYDILDISGSGAPTLLGSISQIGSYSHGALANGHLVTAAASEMRVFNLSNVASPQLVATVSDQVRVNGVSALGNQVFVPLETASTIGFRSYSLSNPASPTAQSSVALRGRSESVFAHGNRGYVPQFPRELAIYDNIAQARGTLLGTYHAVPIAGVVASGSIVYAVSGANDETTIRILNAANAGNVSELASLPMPTFVRHMAVDANHLFAVLGAEMRIYDVNNPAAPILRSTWQAPLGSGPLKVIASGNRAYIGGNDRVWVLDITQRTAPVLIGQLQVRRPPKAWRSRFPIGT